MEDFGAATLSSLPRQRQIMISAVWTLNYEGSALLEPARRIFGAIGCMYLSRIPASIVAALVASEEFEGLGPSRGPTHGGAAYAHWVDTLLVKEFCLLTPHEGALEEGRWYCAHPLSVRIMRRHRTPDDFRRGLGTALRTLHTLCRGWIRNGVLAPQFRSGIGLLHVHRTLPHIDVLTDLSRSVLDRLHRHQLLQLASCHIVAGKADEFLCSPNSAIQHFQAADAILTGLPAAGAVPQPGLSGPVCLESGNPLPAVNLLEDTE